MIKKKTIDSFSLRYIFVNNYASFYHWLFYRKIEASHLNNIPKDRPVLFAPNHQNALMDALGALYTSRRALVFLARSDIFKNKFIAGILRIFKILPVFRIRDGASELSKNEEIFEEAINVLTRGNIVCIMPEGNHGGKRRLRPLVKGIFRVAFQTQKQFGDQPGVVIVPVGIDYSSYSNFRGKLLVNFGEAIEVCEYYAAYQENQPKALNLLKDRLSSEMRKYMIDIRSTDYYDMHYNLRDIYNSNMRNELGLKKKDLYSRFLADKKMYDTMEPAETDQPDKIRELADKVQDYTSGVKKLNLRDWVLRKDFYAIPLLLIYSLALLAFSPLFLYGFSVNYFPYWLIGKLPKKMAKKDAQFHSSIKFAVGVLSIPLYYLILFLPVWILTDTWWIKWAFLFSLPLSGFFAHSYYIWFKKLRSLWKYDLLKIRKDRKILDLKDLRTEIIRLCEQIIKPAL